MIVGIGLDLVETARFRKLKRGVAARLFTAAERAYCARRPDPPPHYAARFAAKEAVLKALGTGWSGGIAWTDVEVVRRPKGAVGLKVTGKAGRVARKLGIRAWHLSICHTAAHAAALAVAEE